MSPFPEGPVGVEFVRVEYNVETAARGILESELPSEFADVLRTAGRLPAAEPDTVASA